MAKATKTDTNEAARLRIIKASRVYKGKAKAAAGVKKAAKKAAQKAVKKAVKKTAKNAAKKKS